MTVVPQGYWRQNVGSDECTYIGSTDGKTYYPYTKCKDYQYEDEKGKTKQPGRSPFVPTFVSNPLHQ